jgi:hypothetical protein
MVWCVIALEQVLVWDSFTLVTCHLLEVTVGKMESIVPLSLATCI